MIRINLLGQKAPKPGRGGPSAPSGAALPLVLLLVSVAIAVGVCWWMTNQVQKDIDARGKEIQEATAQKVRLENVKLEVEELERQKPFLEQRRAVIDDLQRNKTGGRELLEAVAATVNRSETLWLTQVTRRGGSLTIDGTAASINAVANFITELKRSGYFDKVEIKESRQDDRTTAATVFLFSLTADFVLPQSKAPAVAGTPPGKG